MLYCIYGLDGFWAWIIVLHTCMHVSWAVDHICNVYSLSSQLQKMISSACNWVQQQIKYVIITAMFLLWAFIVWVNAWHTLSYEHMLAWLTTTQSCNLLICCLILNYAHTSETVSTSLLPRLFNACTIFLIHMLKICIWKVCKVRR